MIEPRPLNFNFYRPRDGRPDWKAIHGEAVERAREIAPLIHKDSDDTLVDKTADAIRQAKSVATAADNFRINRKRWQEGNHALRPLYFIWTLLYACNFRCIYCDDHRGNHYYDLDDNPLSFEDRARVIRTMRTGTSAVYFCGGEPTLVKELPEFTDMAFGLGYKPIMINTNGFNLNEMLKKPSGTISFPDTGYVINKDEPADDWVEGVDWETGSASDDAGYCRFPLVDAPLGSERYHWWRTRPWRPVPRHVGLRTNCLFFDGHVATYPCRDLVDDNWGDPDCLYDNE